MNVLKHNQAITLPGLILAAVMLIVLLNTPPAQGQGYHQPLSQHTPPGQTAAWLNHIRKYDPSWLQPMRVTVEGGGKVEVYSGSTTSVGGSPAPAIVAANVGHLYRMRISGMANFPGQEVYPTVELIDRLHPPQGREDEFALPIILTKADMRIAMSGQMVTRVIYLEQPQLAQTFDPLDGEIPQSVPPNENALMEADRLGRPMAIIRIGGRMPSPASPPDFFGTGGMVQIRPVPEMVAPQPPGIDPPATVRMNAPSSGIIRTSAQRVR